MTVCRCRCLGFVQRGWLRQEYSHGKVATETREAGERSGKGRDNKGESVATTITDRCQPSHAHRSFVTFLLEPVYKLMAQAVGEAPHELEQCLSDLSLGFKKSQLKCVLPFSFPALRLSRLLERMPHCCSVLCHCSVHNVLYRHICSCCSLSTHERQHE